MCSNTELAQPKIIFFKACTFSLFPVRGRKGEKDAVFISFVCLVAKVGPTPLQPQGLYSPPGSSARGVSHARIQARVAVSSHSALK